MKYSIEWLKHRFDEGETFKWIFFWGHQPHKAGQINKSCLSQWWIADFEVDGITYRSAEHWMMAGKARLFSDQLALERILNANSPAEAKKIGRQVRNFNQAIWNEHKYEIVKKGNFHKFNQSPEQKEFLINTKNRILVEASPYDKIWGIGMRQDEYGIENPYNWKGPNLLGFAIMEVRDELMM
ncbi:MAG: NADAR family protein [Chitinophagales bacterium]|nr:NADAR family protein [Chitinophagales bacterium]